MSSVATEAPAIAPGLHKAIAYETYSRWDAVNHSLLKEFNRTAAHARETLLSPRPQTEALAFGHATHLAVLEPERFDGEVVAAPKIDKRYKEGKLEWSAFQAAHEGKALLPVEEYASILRMRDAVYRHPTAAELLRAPGLIEVSALWVDGETGMRCRSRFDRLTTTRDGWSVIVDLKSAEDASRAAFERAVHKYRYYQQGAMYLDGCAALAPRPRRFMFIVVEKDPPHCVAVYELDDMAVALGLDEYQKHLQQYADCVRTNVWPAYGDGADLVSLPAWAFRGFEG